MFKSVVFPSKGAKSNNREGAVEPHMAWGATAVQRQSIWEQTWEHKKKRGWRLISEEPAVIKPKAPVKRSAWP